MPFSERYGERRRHRESSVREYQAELIDEHLVQCIWYDRLFRQRDLKTQDGVSLKIVSPGWWNHGEGPDFRGAQIEFDGRPRTGDVEIHLAPSGWKQHGHHLDERYDEVMLHVILDPGSELQVSMSAGHRIPSLVLEPYLESEIQEIADDLKSAKFPKGIEGALGRCAHVANDGGVEVLAEFVDLAGEWRMINKARQIRERMDRIGADQAIYEMLLTACGYSHFKEHFKAVARQLPYDRVKQLGQENALLLEAALLQISGLFPQELPEGTAALPHVARLRGLRNSRLEGLRSMPITWKRIGVRPINYPERRMAGAAGFLARSSKVGLADTLHTLWKKDLRPIDRRRAFEDLFPSAMGFWATHCTWTGKALEKAAAPLGGDRIRSIIGNVFVPAGLAMARDARDRDFEDRVLRFFAALPKEPENRVIKLMIPRVFGDHPPKRINFQSQQGLIQMYQDWCEPNPSCANCRVMSMLGEKACAK